MSNGNNNWMKINRFIQEYINNDGTRSAVMIHAPWGTGKSYYIENGLIPYLNLVNGLNTHKIDKLNKSKERLQKNTDAAEKLKERRALSNSKKLLYNQERNNYIERANSQSWGGKP